MTGSPEVSAVREALRTDPIDPSSLTSSAQFPQAGLEGSPAQRVLTQGARQLLTLGRLDLADELAARAMAENDSCADTHSVVASILDARGDWPGALAHLRRAHALMPNGPQVRLNLALALLRLGDYREGFALYEARIDKPTWAGFATAHSRATSGQLLLRPGDRVEGQRIVVLAEQGLGDAIMAARYISILAQHGARVTLACNSTLRPFFARIPGIETLLSPPPDQPSAQINLAALAFDAWVPLLSLPRWFGTEAASIPAEMPYWTPDPTRVAAWRKHLAEAGRRGARKVGLVLQANPASSNYADRSMQVRDILPLLGLDAIDIVNLQHGRAGRELSAAAPSIIDPIAPTPLDEYAAALAATDLLVSVDTMAAHCAGAMGHPCWIAVPHSPQWTWGLDQETTPWYPSVRIFRQAKPRDWSNTIAALALQLNELFAASQTAGSTHPLNVQRQNLQPAAANLSAPLPEQGVQDRHSARCLAQVASALVVLGKLDLAQIVAEIALRTDNECDDRHDAMADVHQELGNWEVAFEHRLKSAMPGSHAHRLKLGVTQLLRGDLEEGFANYEARLSVPTWMQQALPTSDSLATLQGRQLRPGDPMHGRHILVFTEPGLGDALFGARFLPILAERGAEITLVCRPPLRPFFTRLKCLKAIFSPPEDKPHAKINLGKLAFDAFCPMLSLAYVLGIARNTDIPNAPYLSADPVQTAAWRARYAREGRIGRRKVGLVWQASPSNRALANRSMRAGDLAPLALLDDVDLVNLQHGPSGRELSRFVPQAIDATQEPLSVDAFAAALAATDLVVTVDTMAAHCAGAFGHPVWVALPTVPTWYWGLRGAECVWYPTARLFRQTVQDDWSSAIAEITAQLQDGFGPSLPPSTTEAELVMNSF
jgi:ADP-heptose:LPS heptosyltransferase/Tfp pilus assembly protein PilF